MRIKYCFSFIFPLLLCQADSLLSKIPRANLTNYHSMAKLSPQWMWSSQPMEFLNDRSFPLRTTYKASSNDLSYLYFTELPMNDDFPCSSVFDIENNFDYLKKNDIPDDQNQDIQTEKIADITRRARAMYLFLSAAIEDYAALESECLPQPGWEYPWRLKDGLNDLYRFGLRVQTDPVTLPGLFNFYRDLSDLETVKNKNVFLKKNYLDLVKYEPFSVYAVNAIGQVLKFELDCSKAVNQIVKTDLLLQPGILVLAEGTGEVVGVTVSNQENLVGESSVRLLASNESNALNYGLLQLALGVSGGDIALREAAAPPIAPPAPAPPAPPAPPLPGQIPPPPLPGSASGALKHAIYQLPRSTAIFQPMINQNYTVQVVDDSLILHYLGINDSDRRKTNKNFVEDGSEFSTFFLTHTLLFELLKKFNLEKIIFHVRENGGLWILPTNDWLIQKIIDESKNWINEQKLQHPNYFVGLDGLVMDSRNDEIYKKIFDGFTREAIREKNVNIVAYKKNLYSFIFSRVIEQLCCIQKNVNIKSVLIGHNWNYKTCNNVSIDFNLKNLNNIEFKYNSNWMPNNFVIKAFQQYFNQQFIFIGPQSLNTAPVVRSLVDEEDDDE